MKTFLTSALIVVACCLALPAQAGQLSDRGFKELKKKLKVAAAQQDQDGVAQVLHDLGLDDSERAVDLILKTALAVPTGKVLTAAGEALADMRGGEAVEALVAWVEKRGGHPGAKILCIDALGGHSDAATGAALGTALGDKRPEVIRAALAAVRKRKAREAVPGLIDLFERLSKTQDAFLENEVNDALFEITGKAFEDAADWRKFWEVAQAEDRPMTGHESGTGERVKKPRPTFFGSEIASDRVVFVIDVSGSMDGTRIKQCKTQLSGCIDALTNKSAFTIVAFSDQIRVWNKRLQQASPANKNKARAFIEGFQASGATYTLSALKSGFEVEGADTLVLLSDGAPTENGTNGQPITVPDILDEVRGVNKFKKWRVDTFGFGAAGDFEKFLKDLAQEHGGKFTPIN